ncbi:unnamed protein product [Didymodactylos carnosus]|uniref:NAD(P)(+)--arginine ADP-ribosyltransferase n=1 Tax=Didymodactylos carnosus TaxID=1234261 RepID=A0A8S2P8C4_9BILA|nr:unnamed protein product [Didymodactylos carnosus]CAF4036348.1 unnamed protein product [Didymodactylos carnosus]
MIMKPKGREGGRGREEGGRAEGGRRTGGGFGGTGRKRELRRLSDALGDLGAAEALSNEDISLIWFDADMVEGNEEKAKLKETVQDEVSNAVFFYTNKTACMAYIESQTKAKIFFILSSDSYEVDEFPAIHAIVQIDCILILSTNTEKYETLLNNTTFPKIVDIFAELTPLLESIKKQVSLLAKQSAAFSLYDQNQKATRNLSQETGSFLYLQLFKDVLMKMPHTEESKLEMLDKCRGYCRGNKKEMGNINDFYLTYKSNEDSLTIVHKVLKIKHKANDSIPWYTKETFLYRLVNKAMRTEDIEALYTFRFFIVDLSNMLQRRYRLFKRKLGKKEAAKHTVYLYRGFQQSPEEIQKLRENVGNLISTNGFLSTSRARSVALGFARNINRPNVEPVLFEIKTCTALRTAVFTDIKEFSAFPEEEEVLFDLGACFSIDSFEYDEEEKLWTQKMSATDRGLEIVEEYMEFRRKEMAEFDVVIMFGNLLLDMGEYLKAQKYFENLIRVRPDHEHAPSIYGNIAIAHYYKGEYDDAMTNYKKAYDIFINTKPIRYPDAARALNGIGIINRLKQNYDAALESYEQALLLYQKKYKPVHIEVANTLNSIGIIHNKKNEFDQGVIDK